MDFFKVWQWPQQLAGFGVSLLLLAAAGWYVDRRLEAHYTAKVRAAVAEEAREARVLQSKANTAAVANYKAGQATANKVLDQRLNEVMTYAKTLPKNAACLADPEFVRLYNNGGRAR